MSNGITNTSKRSLKIIFVIYFILIFVFKLETLYKSKQDTLNEKEMRIGDRFKAELDV
jgi:preprotein translocase subunit SecG